jgi:hypothetical protein
VVAAVAAITVAVVPKRLAPPVVVLELLLGIVVAITTLATETGHMRASTAAGLVGAAMLSTLVFPFVGMALRSHSEADREPHAEPEGLPSARRGARRPSAAGEPGRGPLPGRYLRTSFSVL